MTEPILLSRFDLSSSFEAQANTFGFSLKGRPWTTTELADWAQCSTNSLEVMRCKGTGPKFLKIGRLVRYAEFDILNWISDSNSNFLPTNLIEGGVS